MTHLAEQPTAERLQQVARQTYHAIRKREHAWSRWLSSQNDLDRAVQECVDLAQNIDPAGFSEATFADVISAIGQVIDALSRYFTEYITENDVAQCHFLGHSLQSLKDSKRWLVQGLSPNPSKRPTPEARERMSKDLAGEIFTNLRTA